MFLAVKVGVLEDFNTEPHPLHTESVNFKTSSSSQNNNQNDLFIPIVFLPLFFFHRSSMTRFSSNKEALEASKKIVSDEAPTHLLRHTCEDLHMIYYSNININIKK